MLNCLIILFDCLIILFNCNVEGGYEAANLLLTEKNVVFVLLLKMGGREGKGRGKIETNEKRGGRGAAEGGREGARRGGGKSRRTEWSGIGRS